MGDQQHNASHESGQENAQEMARVEWNETAEAWRAYSDQYRIMLQAATNLLIDALQIHTDMQLLDIAGGPGEPALTLASLVAPDGHVMATDVAPALLSVAAENAEKRGVMNVSFRQADVGALPFPDAAFDAVTCRFGVMHFPDVPRALGEIARVLTPGGRVAFTAWGPAEQHSQMRLFAVVGKYAPMPLPEPGTLPMFRFAAPGTLAAAVQAAGFHDVRETQHTIAMPWPGPPEEVWDFLLKQNPPMRHGIAMLAPDIRAQLTDDVLDWIRERYDGAHVNASAAVIVVSGTC